MRMVGLGLHNFTSQSQSQSFAKGQRKGRESARRPGDLSLSISSVFATISIAIFNLRRAGGRPLVALNLMHFHIHAHPEFL
jgi:hypothetical protein